MNIRAVAREAGVSTSTVSRALRGLDLVNGETRAAVERAARKLGYTVSASASGLASGRTRMIAVVVPSLTKWYHVTAVEGADEVLRAAGYDTMLVNLGRAAPSGNRLFQTALLRKRVDAAIVVATDFTPQETEQLSLLGLPTIGVGGTFAAPTRVGIDEVGVARTATEHLIALGHRRIGYVGGVDDPSTDSSMARLRAAGWQEAMSDAGLAAEPAWQEDGGFTAAQARLVARRMLDRPGRPTAVYAASDEMAFGVMQAARDLGIAVPADLSVVGTDDHEYAEVMDLTTVRQDPAAQARLAADLLVGALGGEALSDAVTTAPIELVVRGSTAPPTPDSADVTR